MLLFALATASALEVDFASHDGHTYAFVNEWLTWEEADALCADNGAALAVVNDAAELRFLLRSIHGGPRFNDGNDSWLGATALGSYAGLTAPGLILTWPWEATIESAFWVRPIDTAEQKAVCER